MRRLAPLLLGASLLTSAAGGASEPRPMRGLRAEIAALLVQGVEGGSLPIAAAVFPPLVAASGDAVDLLFLMEIPAAPPAAAEGERPVEVYAYAVGETGEVAAHYAVTLPDWPSEGDGVRIAGSLPVTSGRLSVRFLAWDSTTRQFGIAVREVHLDGGPGTPRVADRCSEWVLVAGQQTEVAGLAARPVLLRGERQRLAAADAATGVGSTVRFVARGETAPAAGVALTEAAPGELEFVVPDLPNGVYQLSLAAEGGRPGPALESWLVSSLPPGDGGCTGSWTRILQHVRSAGSAAQPEAPAAIAERPARRLAADYAALLARLAATGDMVAAAGELAGLEEEFLRHDLDLLRPLFAAQLKAARELAERDARSLLPLVVLSTETARVHHAAGRQPQASHGRRLALAIGEQAAGSLKSPAERALVAVALTGLAYIAETLRSSLEAQRVLERALELDPSREATRLLLAASYERRGRYADARKQLEALVAINSAHYEARVRLAILLRRMGSGEEAEALLRAIVNEKPPPWLLALGYQTLAQLLIREARLGEAIAELERGRRRLPGDQVLRVLLAYALDRDGQRRRARETLAELPPAAAAATPRYRYSDEPVAALGLQREMLRQGVTVRLPLLAQALAAGRAGGPAG